MTSHNPPMLFATGDCTRRDRNHRIPSNQGNIGNRKAPTPNACSNRSALTAPTIPTQLRAERAPVSTEALLKEGSRGEYEASARKRRSAETHNKKPTSSLSRRLFVGLKTCEKNFMKA